MKLKNVLQKTGANARILIRQTMETLELLRTLVIIRKKSSENEGKKPQNSLKAPKKHKKTLLKSRSKKPLRKSPGRFPYTIKA